MAVLRGEPLAMGTPWPPSLLGALQCWGTTHPKAPCLTALDTMGKATCTLTYGKYQQDACVLVHYEFIIHALKHKHATSECCKAKSSEANVAIRGTMGGCGFQCLKCVCVLNSVV
jgi:hypothetical protein